MAPIDSLPDELLDEIMEHLAADSNRYHPCGDLRQLSLVCQRWREPTQRALFQNVVLQNERMADAWLRSPGRQRYRVRCLKMGNWNIWLPMSILEACPDLRSLSLSESEDGGYEWCSSALVEGLISLQIPCPEFFPIDAGPLATRNLRHLTFSGERNEVNSDRFIHYPSRHSLVYLSLEYMDLDSAPSLVECFAEKPFPLVSHLVLKDSTGYDYWTKLLSSFPSLLTLEMSGAPSGSGSVEESITAIGASAIPTLRNLIFTQIKMDGDELTELLRIIKLPNLAGLRRLEISMTPKYDLTGKTGLALLDECEKRSISLLCCYGWLTRDMMEKDAHGD